MDARSGLLLLRSGRAEPLAMMPVAGATFTVDTANDFVSANPSACANGVAGQCSLRQAVREANANDRHKTILVPGGTYTLTLAGMGDVPVVVTLDGRTANTVTLRIR